jgi:hypothetical protein
MDAGGDVHSLHKLVWVDVTDKAVRASMLGHIADQARLSMTNIAITGGGDGDGGGGDDDAAAASRGKEHRLKTKVSGNGTGAGTGSGSGTGTGTLRPSQI